ncbi:rubrerythrin family protein [archaeon]|jgi:rubrerythrin|nr:rubrerythrin family protein [archaeon]MBT3730827.1 rubrerythrin family protein [archaeon]MBT4670141.1 rubrerythrin family protein [archaeon]MBT5030569.1 rubrerythrin family protein [archaeon]MBT5287922.1 rubrerythrin family protein [archaeon]
METINNLIKAYIGECQARNRYTFYAKIAKKESFELVSSIFLETAEQEKVHAKRLFEHIQELKKEEEINLEVTVPLVYSKTKENLKAAINGENFEHTKMYPEFADIAEKEGFEKIAKRLRSIAKAEEHHEQRFQRLLELIENNKMFKRDEEQVWICRECGYIHNGIEAPEDCPSCDHPRAYYQIQNENY